MKFEYVLNDFKRGFSIRRQCWFGDRSIGSDSSKSICLSVEDILSEDWEVVHLTFDKALNALLNGKTIARAEWSNNCNKFINISHGKIYMGLGTYSATSYSFTNKDINAQDWIIKD